MNSHHVQQSNVTRLNRYPQVFAAASHAIAAAGQASGRVLSYGCSTGEEPATLAEQYLPDATIVGLDVSSDALEQARARLSHLSQVTVALSTPESLEAHGPFDAIFAMSVLCRWPVSRRMDSIAQLFSFEMFCNQVASLDAVLKPGGILVIYNANYEFLQSTSAKNYDVVLSPRIKTSGFVKKFKPDGTAAAESEVTACIFRKRPSHTEAAATLRVYSEKLVKIGEIPRDLGIA